MPGLGRATAAQSRSTATGRRPNIIFILADDLGYGDLGCYGQKRIQTPSLDRMAAEGMRFTQAYAGSTVCAPSRCCLMTGLHTGHALVRGNSYPDTPLRPQDITVTELLAKAGYRTGLFGKWSLGHLGSSGYALRKGFEEWFGFFSQTHAHNYYPEHLLDNETAYLLRGNFGAKKTEYAHDLFTERAVRFLEKEDGRPFFLHVCYTIPHANNEMGRDTGDGMEIPGYEPYDKTDWPKPEKGFAAMITRMDRDIGKMLDLLRASGRDRDTLVIFSSDNGPHKEGGHDADFFQSSGPLRGAKRDLYEGGIRVPTLAWWPGSIKPGQVSDHAWAFWDFLPTCTGLAGLPEPSGLDGISIVPALLGQTQRNHDYLYWEFHEGGFKQAVRTGDWKGVRLAPGEPLELYNLKTDIGEKNNVADKHPDVVQKVESILKTARTDSKEFPISVVAKPGSAKKPKKARSAQENVFTTKTPRHKA
ncbi:arylsulfatase [Candidatus Sumerlaeota bacterium]|nr:arylsulfatase [Candidatus Sumerlaeota bacterium]